MTNPKLQARVAGFLYLIVVVAGTFALISTSGFIERDASSTAAKILASEQVFRLAFVSNLIAAVAYTAVVAILYRLFKPVNATLSTAAAFIGIAGCASSAAFMVNQLAALAALDTHGALSALGAEQAQAMAWQSLRLGALGNSISLVFFGFYCLLLGWLVIDAHFLPRIFGPLLAIAGAGWLGSNLLLFTAPEIGAPLLRYLVPVSGLCEFSFTLWLLFMGVDAARWRTQAGDA